MISETKLPEYGEPQCCCAENSQTQTQWPPLLKCATPPIYGHAGFEQEVVETCSYIIYTCKYIWCTYISYICVSDEFFWVLFHKHIYVGFTPSKPLKATSRTRCSITQPSQHCFPPSCSGRKPFFLYPSLFDTVAESRTSMICSLPPNDSESSQLQLVPRARVSLPAPDSTVPHKSCSPAC